MTLTKGKMKIKRVAVSAVSFVKNTSLVAELKNLGNSRGFDVILNETQRVLDQKSLVGFFTQANADAAIVGTEIINGEVLAAAPSLQLIAKYGVGLDNLDEAELKRRGITLAWKAGVNKRSVSELVLALALGHFHKASAGIATMRQGQWIKDGGVQLSDLRVGIVGFGHVGSDLSEILRAFGSDVVVHDTLDKNAEAAALGARQVSYEDLLTTSDLITFHVPATAATSGMFGARELAKVKPNALIVNTSRGSVLDVAAVANAAVRGDIGGLAIDVYPAEPYRLESAWASCPTIYCTPHIGGNTREAVLAMGRAAIAGIREALAED